MIFLPYLYLFIFTILLFYFNVGLYSINRGLSKSINICIFYLFGIVTIVFICCRGYLGQDWFFYKPFFDEAPALLDNREIISHFFEKSNWGKGYTFFNIVCKTISDNYLFFQFCSALIDLILLHFVFLKYCHRYYLLAWGLFFAFSGYGFEILYLRNTKSMYLFLLSLEYLDKKKLRYFLINFIGLLFHTSAIIYFPLYFVLKNNPKERKYKYLIIFLIGIIFFLLKIQWVKVLLGSILPFIPGATAGTIKAYLLDVKFSSEYSFSLGMIERIITFFIVYKFHKPLSQRGLNSIIKLLYCYIYIYLYCAEFCILIARLTALFIPSYWILYPAVYSLVRKQGKIMFIVFFLSYCCLKIVDAMSVNFYTYENFLFSNCDPLARKFL